MHFIQKHILRELAQHASRRYGELQPQRIPSNTFSYHLRKLIAGGFVKKVRDGYALTSKGVHLSTTVHFEDYSVRIQPKIVTLIACRDAAGRFLMYRRAKQPFLGMIGFPYGKVHLGETVAKAAARELAEKCGTHATLAHKGIIYLLVTDAAGEIIAHMLAHIFLGTAPRQEGAPAPAGFGTTHWMTRQALAEAACMPGVFDVLRIATSRARGLAFEELAFAFAHDA
ncbi:MAG TPA: NUDIX domain-containing protein [Candidatus Paceibacterota bacterium]|nr:NUDIX domain-containing protein [Candidatus Paceibacterota bacterium]